MMSVSNISCQAIILRNNIEIGELQVISCRVKYNSKSNVKRACMLKCSSHAVMYKHDVKEYDYVYPSLNLYPSNETFTVGSEYAKKEYIFNKISDRIKVYLIENGTRKSLGVYMIVSSPLNIDGNEATYEFELYDETMILEQNQIGDRYFIKKGTPYIQAIKQLLAEKAFKLVLADDNDDLLVSDREWELGTQTINIINTLLHEIVFNDIHVNSNGYVMLTKKDVKYSPEFYYGSGESSILEQSLSTVLDTYKIPNVFVGVVSNPDTEDMRYKIVNDKIDSSVSTVNRGYEITQVYRPDSISSIKALEWYVKDKFNKSISQTETVKISTALESGHEFENVVQLETNEVKGLFKEVSWEMDVNFQGSMQHTLEREVFI